MRSILPFLLVSVVAISACDSGGEREEAPVYPIQTDQLVYEMESMWSYDGRAGAVTRIPIVFTNLSADTVFVQPLYRAYPQKLVNGEWVTAAIAVTPLPGIPLEPVPPGGALSDTVDFRAFYPGQSIGPEFTEIIQVPADVPGRYRLIRRLFSDGSRRPAEIMDEEYRVSNEFDVVWAPGEGQETDG